MSYAEEFDRETKRGGLPIAYFREGKISLRMLRDNQFNAFSRTVWSHRFDGMQVQCQGRDQCPICAVANEATELGMGSAWKIKANSQTLFWAHVYTCDPPQKYIKIGQPLVLSVNFGVWKAITDAIRELEDEKEKFLDPASPYRPMIVKAEKRQSHAHIAPTGEPVIPPPLAANHESLGIFIIEEGVPVNEAILRRMTEVARGKLTEWLNVKEPTAKKEQPKCPGESVGLKFGGYTDTHTICQSCQYANECMLAAKESAKDEMPF
jgi:hypothetical protein